MENHEEFKTGMGGLEKAMAEAMKRERAQALEKVKELGKAFGFTARMITGTLAEGWKK